MMIITIHTKSSINSQGFFLKYNQITAPIKRTIRDDCSVDCPQMPLQKHKLWRKGYWDTVYRDEPYFLLVFPLLAPDTSLPECPRISGLYTRGNYTDTVTVQWAYDSLHQEFELSYGREGTRPEEGTIVTVFDNRWQFSDTAYSDTPMVAYVRTVCRENDTLRWSGWSSPVYWRLHHVADDTTHLEGITVPDEESNLSHYVQLMPNPASEKVMVLSSYGIDRMEVFDVRGKRMLEQSVSERQPMADFDVSTWTKGAYVVFVYTPAGTVAKRLVVK